MRFLELFVLAACTATMEAQGPAGSILNIELINSTLYRRGFCTGSDVGKNSSKLPATTVVPFTTALGLADIVSVNGQPAKGFALEIIEGSLLSSTLTPGRSIADISVGPAATSWDLTLLNPDATIIGTIHIDGHGGGPAPPGAPKEITNSAWTVTGGSGAFLGARGYWISTQDSVSGERQTSDCEDPAYRRINADAGGNKRHGVLYLIPLEQPQILATTAGPAVLHAADGTQVTAAKPAKAGEILTLFASGLGPTKPGVDPGQPFTADPLQVVNSPVQLLVNGNPGDVLYAGGYPGAVDGYQVNFRLPSGVTAGQASIRLGSAWMLGPEVKIPVQ
jgi:hypothetical protein